MVLYIYIAFVKWGVAFTSVFVNVFSSFCILVKVLGHLPMHAVCTGAHYMWRRGAYTGVVETTLLVDVHMSECVCPKNLTKIQKKKYEHIPCLQEHQT